MTWILNLAATFQHSHDRSFSRVGGQILAPRVVHVACFPANKSLVDFDFAVRTAAEFSAILALQPKANPMEHEPSGFLSDANGAGDLVRTLLSIFGNSTASRRQQSTSQEAMGESSKIVPTLAENWRLGVNALACTAILVALVFCRNTTSVRPQSGAGNDTIRPAQQGHVGQSVVRVGIKDDRLLQSLWLLVIAFHAANIGFSL